MQRRYCWYDIKLYLLLQQQKIPETAWGCDTYWKVWTVSFSSIKVSETIPVPDTTSYQFFIISIVHLTECSSLTGVLFLVGIVIEIALNVNDRSSLVSGTWCQVAQRTKQVCKSSRSSPLCNHLSHKVCILCLDGILYCIFKFISAQVSKVIVCKVFELKLVRLSLNILCSNLEL